MIAKQRKAHKLVWLLMAVVAPILLFFAIKDLDFAANIKATETTEQFKVDLAKDRTVLITLSKPLPSSSSVLYEIDAAGKLGKVMGQLQGKGTYKFQVSEAASGIAIVDKIKNENIYTTTF